MKSNQATWNTNNLFWYLPAVGCWCAVKIDCRTWSDWGVRSCPDFPHWRRQIYLTWKVISLHPQTQVCEKFIFMTHPNFYVKPWCCCMGKRLWKFYSVNLGLSSLPTLSRNFATSLGFCQGRALGLVCNTEGEQADTDAGPGAGPLSSPSTLPRKPLSAAPRATQTCAWCCSPYTPWWRPVQAQKAAQAPPAEILGGMGWAPTILRRDSSEASGGSEVWGGNGVHVLLLSSHPLLPFTLLSYMDSRESFPLHKWKPAPCSPAPQMVYLSNDVSTPEILHCCKRMSLARKSLGTGSFLVSFFFFSVFFHVISFPWDI